MSEMLDINELRSISSLSIPDAVERLLNIARDEIVSRYLHPCLQLDNVIQYTFILLRGVDRKEGWDLWLVAPLAPELIKRFLETKSQDPIYILNVLRRVGCLAGDAKWGELAVGTGKYIKIASSIMKQYVQLIGVLVTLISETKNRLWQESESRKLHDTMLSVRRLILLSQALDVNPDNFQTEMKRNLSILHKRFSRVPHGSKERGFVIDFIVPLLPEQQTAPSRREPIPATSRQPSFPFESYAITAQRRVQDLIRHYQTFSAGQAQDTEFNRFGPFSQDRDLSTTRRASYFSLFQLPIRSQFNVRFPAYSQNLSTRVLSKV